jgi:hypothetical protein
VEGKKFVPTFCDKWLFTAMSLQNGEVNEKSANSERMGIAAREALYDNFSEGTGECREM